MGKLSGRAAVGHLLRRAAFGPGPATDDLLALPYAQAVERLLAGLAQPATPAAGLDPFRPGAIQQAWTTRLLSGQAALAERLTFFWHGHFATSQSKVVDGALLWQQLETLRAHGAGRFEALLLHVSRDVAMVRWLDGNSNRKGHPNENYARELMELFALGRGAYEEQDVREVARCFSGWGSRHHEFVFTPLHHDAGEKTVFGSTGRFGGEDAVRLVAEHPACAPFLCGKLLASFVGPDASRAFRERLVATWRQAGGDLARVLRALLLDDEFLDARHARALVRSPVEFVVAAARARGLAALPDGVAGSMDRQGQVLFRPPSVKGWPSGTAWLTAGTLLERLRAAQALARGVPPPEVDAILAREFDGAVPPALAEVLEGTAGSERLALAFAAPEFQVA